MRHLTFIFLLLLTACYPAYKTVQPSASFTVVDENHKPVEEAEVILVTYATPYQKEKFRDRKVTNTDGKAGFDSINQIHLQILMPHGQVFYSWNWCIHKEGYMKAFDSTSDYETLANKVVTLRQGVSQPCPLPQDIHI